MIRDMRAIRKPVFRGSGLGPKFLENNYKPEKWN